MSLEPTGTICFQGIPPARGCRPPAWLSLLLGIPWGQRSGRAWTSAWGPSQPDPCPQGLEAAQLPTLLSGPIPSLPHLGLLPWVNEPRVGPAHPSRPPLAPAASGIAPTTLVPVRQPWLPASHPQEPKVLLYITPGDVSIFIAVLKIHVLHREPPYPTPSLPHPNKRFPNPCGSWGNRIDSWVVSAAVMIPTSSYWGEYTFFF